MKSGEILAAKTIKIDRQQWYDPGFSTSQYKTLCQCVWQHHLTYCCEHKTLLVHCRSTF